MARLMIRMIRNARGAMLVAVFQDSFLQGVHSVRVRITSGSERACRPLAAWDHLEVSSATSMGPPLRQ